MRTQSNEPISPVKSIGQELREARERKGKQVDDVWREIKIRPNYVMAIEEGRFEDLPSRAFTIAYVGRYARYLGLDIEKLPERLEAEIGVHHSVFNRRTDIVRAPDRKSGTVTAGLLLAALTIFAYGISLYGALYFVGLIPSD